MVSVLNTVDTGHEDMIHDAQMDHYGTKLATCSSDRSVKIFSVRNDQQTLIANLRGHDEPVWQLAWAHPMYGSLLASCGYDRKVIIWKEMANVEYNGGWDNIHVYDGHDSSVNSVCWAPHDFGLILACGSSDGSISVITHTGDSNWEAKRINNAHTNGCNAVSWGPYLQSGLHGGHEPVKRFVSGGSDNLVKIWREDNGNWVEEQKLDAHHDWVRDVAWAPTVGMARGVIASCSQDCQVFVWTTDYESGGHGWTPKLLHKFNDVVWHLSWSVTGNILAVSGGDNKVSLWKEGIDGQWSCISSVVKGQGQVTGASVTET